MESRSWRHWVRECVSLALGVLVATHVVDGISYGTPLALGLAVGTLAVLNALARPFLQMFLVIALLPLAVVTFGAATFFALWVVNSLLFYFTGMLIDGFRVDGFGAAMWGALCVSVVSWSLSPLLKKQGVRTKARARFPQKQNRGDDDVIDV